MKVKGSPFRLCDTQRQANSNGPSHQRTSEPSSEALAVSSEAQALAVSILDRENLTVSDCLLHVLSPVGAGGGPLGN